MAIYLITGRPNTGKSTLANALFRDALAAGKGAVLFDEDSNLSAVDAVNQLLWGMSLPSPPPTEWRGALSWKPDPTVILVGEKTGMVDALANLLPGFDTVFGPAVYITTDAEMAA